VYLSTSVRQTNNTNMKTNNPNRTEYLLAVDPSKIQASSLKAALEQQKKQQEEADASKALAHFNFVAKAINSKVSEIRAIREREKKELAKLQKLEAARIAFQTDGDCAALNQVMIEVGALRGY
jgi:patatin-like phospholipase/acyl hydrolase